MWLRVNKSLNFLLSSSLCIFHWTTFFPSYLYPPKLFSLYFLFSPLSPYIPTTPLRLYTPSSLFPSFNLAHLPPSLPLYSLFILFVLFCPLFTCSPIHLHSLSIFLAGMITHENTDISIAAVGLVHEMTDVDTILEEEVAMVFIDSLLACQGILIHPSKAFICHLYVLCPKHLISDGQSRSSIFALNHSTSVYSYIS